MTAIIWLIKSDRQRFFLKDRKKPTHSFFLIGGWQVWIFSSARPSEALLWQISAWARSGSTSRPRDEASCRDPRGSGWLCNPALCGGIPSGTKRYQMYWEATSLRQRVDSVGLHCCGFVALVTWGSRIRASPCVHTLHSHHICFLYAFTGQFIVTATRKSPHRFNATTSL